MRTVDLTHELPTGFSLALKNSDFHSGKSSSNLPVTRVESPACLIKNGRTLDRLEPDSFVRDAVLLDLTSMRPRQPIDDEDLEAAEEGAGLALREGEIALIHIGWERNADSKEYWSGHPALSENGAEYLAFKGIIGVGVDAPSVDQLGNQEFPAHSILMRKGIYVLENLCNLGEIDQQRFRLIALPLRIIASVSPVRALALLGDKT